MNEATAGITVGLVIGCNSSELEISPVSTWLYHYSVIQLLDLDCT